MEYQAIELVNRGQVAEAIRLLESEKYWKEKGIYQQGLANFLKEKGSDYSLAASSTEEAIRLAIAGVQSVVATSQAITIIIVLASVLLAFLIINFFSRFIINPLGQLRLDAEKIKQGDFSFEVRVAGEDEIGELSQAFNLMTEAVRHSQASIEQKVAEQTAEVDKKAEELADQKKAILNVLEDIQEEKQKTAKERDKIDTILRSIGDGVFAVDKNFKILVFNEVAAKISGYSVAEALGRPYQEVLNFVLEKDGKINDKFLK
ncbi:MAG: HAMP domain-containing protein, partial [Candidatus Magasanikbacteria bacterium]|nr:HAMP domain-containing protein [Candidatus Magasanikbacteria bacterium]